MNKKVVTTGVAVALAATAVVGGTLAYFTDSQEAKNTFTVGNVKIELTEPKWDETGKKDGETVYAGEPLAKDPTVENVGANPCFVRIKVEGLDQFGEKGNITYRTDYAPDKLGDNWFDGKDGYFYYHAVLEAGKSTDALFDQIVMPTGLTGGEEAKPVVVTAEAVQAQGAKASWTEVQNMSVEEIAAWFDTCMPENDAD